VLRAAGETETGQENIQDWLEPDEGDPEFQLHVFLYLLNKGCTVIIFLFIFTSTTYIIKFSIYFCRSFFFLSFGALFGSLIQMKPD
jgi:hypothetical protein